MRRLGVALIGAGLIARMHLEAWVAAGADVRVHSLDGKAADLAAEFGAKAVDSLAEALDGADAVDICSPTGTHRDVALAAIERGVAVVCEKPLSADVAEAEEIVDAAERAGVPVYPAHDIRFAPAFSRLHDLVAGRDFGAGTVARFLIAGYHPRAWDGYASAESGGILTDQMLHGVDIAYWLFGDVVRVHAHYQGRIEAPAPQGTSATGTAVLTHAKGALSQVVCRWTPTPDPIIRVAYHVSGTGGTVVHDSEWPQEIQVSGGPSGAFAYLGESPFLAEIGEFAAALRGGPAPRLVAHDALAAVRVTQAAARSAWTGRAVELPVKGATA
ncbi:Gfo/Idh/MocA family oxidoreductase [Streptomyces sp. NPDC001941]|uniref:Gfo/Idh/MocA family protein n=1 Tax=Streptomyces sp. NPDC001941 TaxID=3154659 RepID=UPI003331EDBA